MTFLYSALRQKSYLLIQALIYWRRRISREERKRWPERKWHLLTALIILNRAWYICVSSRGTIKWFERQVGWNRKRWNERWILWNILWQMWLLTIYMSPPPSHPPPSRFAVLFWFISPCGILFCLSRTQYQPLDPDFSGSLGKSSELLLRFCKRVSIGWCCCLPWGPVLLWDWVWWRRKPRL